MKTYTGYRFGDNAEGHVTVHHENGNEEPLPVRLDLRMHSDAFNWGYAGSGPAQLAMALAANVLYDDERAQDLHQRLKRNLIQKPSA